MGGGGGRGGGWSFGGGGVGCCFEGGNPSFTEFLAEQIVTLRADKVFGLVHHSCLPFSSVGAVYVEKSWIAIIILARAAVVFDNCVMVPTRHCSTVINSFHRLVAGVGHVGWRGMGGEAFVVCKCPLMDLFDSAAVLR